MATSAAIYTADYTIERSPFSPQHLPRTVISGNMSVSPLSVETSGLPEARIALPLSAFESEYSEDSIVPSIPTRTLHSPEISFHRYQQNFDSECKNEDKVTLPPLVTELLSAAYIALPVSSTTSERALSASVSPVAPHHGSTDFNMHTSAFIRDDCGITGHNNFEIERSESISSAPNGETQGFLDTIYTGISERFDDIIKRPQSDNYNELVKDEDLSSIQDNYLPCSNAEELQTREEQYSQNWTGGTFQGGVTLSSSNRCHFIVAPSPKPIFEIPQPADAYDSPAHSPSPTRSPIVPQISDLDVAIDALREVGNNSGSFRSYDSSPAPFLSSVRFSPPGRLVLLSRSPSPLLIASPRVIVPSNSISSSSDESRPSLSSAVIEVLPTPDHQSMEVDIDETDELESSNTRSISQNQARDLAAGMATTLASALLRMASHSLIYDSESPTHSEQSQLVENVSQVDSPTCEKISEDVM